MEGENYAFTMLVLSWTTNSSAHAPSTIISNVMAQQCANMGENILVLMDMTTVEAIGVMFMNQS